MRLDEFRPEAVPPGSKETLYLDVAPLPDGHTLRLAVLVARGGGAGPTLLVLGGVHGDEYEGPHAVRTVFRALAAARLRGTFIGVPVTNVPAFAAGNSEQPARRSQPRPRVSRLPHGYTDGAHRVPGRQPPDRPLRLAH